MSLYDAAREEMEVLGGDYARDPSGVGAIKQGVMSDPMGERGKGLASQTNFGHGKTTTVIRYKDKLIEADVYALPNTPVHVVIMCPRCGNASTIKGERKAIDWRPHAPQKIGELVNAGIISIEPFECSWELPDAGQHNARNTRQISGFAPLCRLKLAVDKNVAKDA